MDTTNNTHKSSETTKPVSTLSIESPHTERLPWVDAAKVAGIWPLVFGHLPSLSWEVRHFIYSFHMPLFFFLSGYLEKRREVGATSRNSARKLLVPYFAMNLISYAIWLLLLLLGMKNIMGYVCFPDKFSLPDYVVKPLTGISIGSGVETAYSFPVCPPTWFLVALFFVKMISSFVHSRVGYGTKALISFLFIIPIIFLFAKMLGWSGMGFPIDSAFLAFPFLALGSLVKTNEWLPRCVKSMRRRLLCSALGILGLCLLWFLFSFNVNFSSKLFSQPDISRCIYGENIILFYLFGFLGIISALLLCQIYTAKIKIVEIISSGTILILGFHAPFANSVLLKVTENKIGLPFENLLICAGIATVTLCLFALPIRLVSKYFPILLGGRGR
jgi:fucose 4-O-acetylase-like acetyltransferase